MCFIEKQEEVGGSNLGVMQVILQNLQNWSLLVHLLQEQSQGAEGGSVTELATELF